MFIQSPSRLEHFCALEMGKLSQNIYWSTVNYCLKTGTKLFSLNTLKYVSSRAQRICGNHLSIYGTFTQSSLRYAHNNRTKLYIADKISWSINGRNFVWSVHGA